MAVVIQTHFVALQIKLLAQAFVSRGHRVLISVDSDTAFPEIRSWFENEAKCEVVRSLPVIWCGMSQVNMFIYCLNLLLRHNDWDMMINLSGSCILYKPIAELETYLDGQVKSGADAILGHFVAKPNFDRSPQAEAWSTSPWASIERYAGRNLNLTLPSIMAEEWIDIARSPIVNSQQRITYHLCEDMYSKTLSVRPLLPNEAHTRKAYFTRNRLYIGRAWFVFNRTAVEWLLSAGCSSLPWLIMKDSFEPDESIIHTVFLNEAKHLRIFNSNLQIEYGRTNVLSLDEWNNIINDQAGNFGRFFVRKINLDDDSLNKISSGIWLKE